MIVHFGWRPYGTVDQVPGVAHVATVFFHIWWVPFGPVRSYLIIDGSEPQIGALTLAGEVRQTRYGFVGIRTPLRWRSVVMAYARAALVVMFLTAASGAIIFADQAFRGGPMSITDAAVFAGVACCCGLGYWFSRWVTRAGWARANEIRADLGLPPSDEAW